MCCFLPVGEVRAPSMTDFLLGLENSGWLKHIKAIVDAGLFISRVSFLHWAPGDDTLTLSHTHTYCRTSCCCRQVQLLSMIINIPYITLHTHNLLSPCSFSPLLSPSLYQPPLCARRWLMKASVCWSTAQTAGTGRLRPALWPVCCWTRSTEPSEASW